MDRGACGLQPMGLQRVRHHWAQAHTRATGKRVKSECDETEVTDSVSVQVPGIEQRKKRIRSS